MYFKFSIFKAFTERSNILFHFPCIWNVKILVTGQVVHFSLMILWAFPAEFGEVHSEDLRVPRIELI
jgi:hypothetical protein